MLIAGSQYPLEFFNTGGRPSWSGSLTLVLKITAAGVTHCALAEVTTVDTDCDGQEIVLAEEPAGTGLGGVTFAFGNGHVTLSHCPPEYQPVNGGRFV